MNTESSQEIVTQLRITNRLLAAQLRSTMKQNELIVLLSTTGASHSDIATILGTTPGTVGVALARKRQDAAKGR
jgi:DNA-directed RNA polymerase specialized sigma24 family protein